MMKNSKITNVLLLPIFLAFLTSCTIGEIKMKSQEEEESVDKISMAFTMPNPTTNILVNSELADGNEVQFSSKWDDIGNVFMFAKQNGKIINMGQYPISTVDSENGQFRVEVDASKLDTKASYQLYGLSGAFNVDDHELFYRQDLVRNATSNFWFTGQRGSSSVTSQVVGVAEVLYVINKTSQPFVFVHKGFDAEEKWYYTSAEVSVEDGHIQNASQDGDKKGKPKVINVYNGSSFPQVSSFYIPTGKKIQNAQLIAEINGKEVRSENRISSDISLQNGHAYGIFAVWDGEKLTLGDGYREPEVTVLSGGDGIGNMVERVKDDGTIVLSANSPKIPQVGEYVVSDAVEGAPEGFMSRVDAVTKENGAVELKTSPAYLNEVIGPCNETVSLDFKEIESFTRSDGKVFYPSRTRADKTFDFISIDTLYTIASDTLESFKRGNLSGIFSTKLTIELKVALSGTFTAEKKEGEFRFERLGFDLKGELESKVKLDVTGKMAFKPEPISLGQLALASNVIWVTGVPIRIKPVVDVCLVFEASGEITLSFTPIDLSYDLGFSLYYYDHPDELTGKHCVPHYDFPKWNEIKNLFSINNIFGSILDGYLDMGAELVTPKLSVKGEVKAGLEPYFQFRFYGREDTQLAMGFAPYVKLNGELSAKYNLDFDDEPFDIGYNLALTDRLDLGWGIDAEGYIRLPFRIPFTEQHENNKYPIERFNICDFHLWSIASLFPTYHDCWVNPKDDVLRYSSIHIRAEKERPTFILFDEDDFGFCYREKGTTDWKYISLKEKYASKSYGITQSFTMEYDLPTSELKPNKTYIVAPYSRTKTGGLYILRKGSKFKTGGDDTTIYTNLDIVPGRDL